MAYIGLGSNLDNPVGQVRRALVALGELPQSRLIDASPLYRSKPVGPQDQPDFINAVACLGTQLAPEPLLDALQAIERAHRRQRRQRWGPRTLDLDILLYGDKRIDNERLSVPHPHMSERSFVLVPLGDIAPGLRLPDGRHLDTLVARCDRRTLAALPDDGYNGTSSDAPARTGPIT